MQLADYLPLFADKKVVVVGDLYLDEYIIGKPSRISREAPIAVLEFRNNTLYLAEQPLRLVIFRH